MVWILAAYGFLGLFFDRLTFGELTLVVAVVDDLPATKVHWRLFWLCCYRVVRYQIVS